MLAVWPLASWVAALKLWPALSHCTPAACSVCAGKPSPSSTGRPECWLLEDKLLSLSRSLFNSLSFPFSQFFHWLLVSLPLSLSIYQSRLLSQLLRWHVSERWKRCLTVKKNPQLCFILHHTGCCSCLCLSASTAASSRTLPAPHTDTRLLLWLVHSSYTYTGISILKE